MHDQALFNVFGVEEVSVYCGLVLFGMLYSPVSLITSIFTTALSRKNEFEADAYALRALRAFEKELNSLHGSVRKGIDLLAGNALVSNNYDAVTAAADD